MEPEKIERLTAFRSFSTSALCDSSALSVPYSRSPFFTA